MPRFPLVALLFAAAGALILAQDSVPTVTDLNQLAAPGRYRAMLDSGGFARTFYAVMPEHAAGAALPLVFCFHGAGGNGEQAARVYGWAEKARQEHFIAVFPDGLPSRPGESASFLLNPRVWRDGRGGRWTNGVDDIAFFAQLLDRLEQALPIDRRRIYITGFSNGAGLTFSLGAHFPDRIAAIAPVSSQSFAPVQSLARPMPVYYLVGKADPLVPFHGGESQLPWGKRMMQPVQDSVDQWTRLDHCAPEPQPVSDDDGVRVVRYGPGPGGGVMLYTTVDGNGHHWPGSLEPLPHAICGPTRDPFNATDHIWNFFVQHPL